MRLCAARRFHIPPHKRRRIVALLCGNILFQWLTQLCRVVWSSYNASQSMPGALWINLTFVFAILCGIVSGSLQGNAENALRKEKPGEFPPSPADIAIAAFKEERRRRKEELRRKAGTGASADEPEPQPEVPAAAQPPGQKAGGVLAGLAEDAPASSEEMLTPRLQAPMGTSTHVLGGEL